MDLSAKHFGPRPLTPIPAEDGHATDYERIRVRVLSPTIGAEIEGVDMVQIRVEDNGPGFQAGAVSQVFDPYVTTKPKGTGLGLAIVKKLVEEHGMLRRCRNRATKRFGQARLVVRDEHRPSA